MNLYLWLPIGLIVAGNIAYHLMLKTVSLSERPFLLLAIAYGLCAIMSLFISLIFEKSKVEINSQNITYMIVLALGIIGIEAGIAFAYRAGWQVGSLSLFLAPLIAASMFLVGTIFFNIKPSITAGLGFVLGFASLYFLK